MGVYKVKEYKIVKGQQIKKTKEEYNRETCKGTKCWYFKCTYKDIYGNTKPKKSKKFATKEEARKAEAEFLVNNDNKERKANITFNELYNTYFFIDENIVNKESSLYTKEGRIRLHVLDDFKDDDIIDITTEKIKNWKKRVNDRNAIGIKTKRAVFSAFSAIMDYAKEKYNLPYNPLKLVDNFKEKNEEIKDKEEIKFITKEQYNEFIKVVNIDSRTLFHFLYETGCRIGELQALKINDVNFDTGQIRINKTLTSKTFKGGKKITTTKNKTVRFIDISDSLKNDLLDIYNKLKSLDGFNDDWYFFGGIKYISANTVTRRKDEAFDKLKDKGIPRITLHQFRHSSASYMISNGIPIEVIAYRLGDKVETIRKTYAHLFPDTQKEAKNIFEQLGTI